MENREEIMEMIPVYIMGKKYMVPQGLTIMKALEYSGYMLTRGCGCRGGVCGACVTIYRHKKSYKWHIGLACQTVAVKDIFLVQLPYVPAHKAIYDIHSMQPDEEGVVELYPEILRCMGCNTCTRSCPMELEVMNYVSAALQGDWEKVTRLSMDCIMCGMCAARCPAELAPLNIGILVRRMVGRQAHSSISPVKKRLDDIKAGVFDEKLSELQRMEHAQILDMYKEFQENKGEAV